MSDDDPVMPDPDELLELDPDDVDDPIRIAERRLAHEVERHLDVDVDP